MENYSVSLVIGSVVHSPQAAVDSFIEALVSTGLRNWIYVITSDSDEDVYYSDGWGNLMNEMEMKKYVDDRIAGRPVHESRVKDNEDEETEEDLTDLLQAAATGQPELYPGPQQRMVVTVPAAVLNAAMEQVSQD